MKEKPTFETIKRQFIYGLPERFDAIENLLCSITQHDQLPLVLPELLRNTHNLKGSTSTFGMHVLATICHQFEDYIKYADKIAHISTDDAINILLKYIDLMRYSLAQDEEGNKLTPHIDTDLSKLHQVAYPDHAHALVVTESKAMRHICSSILDPLHIHPAIAVDGIDALRRLTYQRFDYLITMLEIQGINGLALINTVHLSSPKNNGIKSILVTSNGKKEIPTYRASDPDAVVYKDQMFIERMTTTVSALMQ